jgi:hypothetical protein
LGTGGAAGTSKRQWTDPEWGDGMRRDLLVAVPLLLLAGCAATTPAGDRPGRTAGAGERRYQTTGTVLQSRGHGPELCLGAVLDSFPPQCGGLPIPNWRWDRVGGHQTASGTTWGAYRLVGTYDGRSFTVAHAEPAPPARRPSAAERFAGEPKSPCPEPSGGWPVPDPARRSERYIDPVSQAARAEPDFAGLWVSYLEPMGHNVAEDPGEFVLNVAFTGDLERHRAELRPLWGGRLCVTRQQRTYRQLRRIQDELQGEVGRQLGLRVLSTGIREDANAVSLEVVVLDPPARRAIDARYGAGAVEATAMLVPVP